MTALDIIKFAAETVGDISEEMLEFGRKAIRLKYQTLYDSHLWRESLRVIESSLNPDLKGVFFLPYDAEEVIFFSTSTGGGSYTRLSYRERDWTERHGGSQVSLPGSTPSYYRAENVAWPYFGPGKMTFTSYDTRIFTLYIKGIDLNGVAADETYKVQAITNSDGSVNPAVVTTANAFYQIDTISKGKTNTPLAISPQFPPGGSMAIALPPGLPDLTFTQLVLTPPPVLVDPTTGDPYNVLTRLQVKLKADPLDSDYAVPRISHIMDGLIEFVLAAMYKKSRQLAKSDSCEQKAIAHIQAAVQIEKNQSENRQQVVPIIYESGDYLNSEYAKVTSSYPWG